MPAAKSSSLVDTRVVYCGDLIYIDPPFNSNRNYEVFWGETKEKRAFEDRHGAASERDFKIASAAPDCGINVRSAGRSLDVAVRMRGFIAGYRVSR